VTRCEFDAKHSIIRWILEGEVTEEVFSDYIQLSAETVPKFPAKGLILDLSKAAVFKVPPSVLWRLANKEPTLAGHFPRVIVAPTDLTDVPARMFSILSETKRPNLHVVRNMADAYEFLKVESPEFREITLTRAQQTSQSS
jgi:hypothetical protein